MHDNDRNMGNIERPEYLKKIEKYLGKEMVIVLTGQRRVGKSCLLLMLRDRFAADPKNNVIFVDKEKLAFDFLRTYQDLNEYIQSRLAEGKRNFILIDEVQDIQGFEKVLRSFRTEPETEIIVTGSNAMMLSSELSTLIGGRYKEIYIQSLSYLEFLNFHGLEDSGESLRSYLSIGGMPALARYSADEAEALEYLRDIIGTVLLKDVLLRNNVRNVAFLENLSRFLADNSGKLISASSIAKYMKSQSENVTASVVLKYLDYLCDAFVIKKAERYDIHGKRIFESLAKFYFEDHGIRNALVGGSREGDWEKVIENVVYQHLVRLGFYVKVGQLRSAEIDFVCSRPDGERCYVQASYLIADEETRKREFGNLLLTGDNYPKYVISASPLVDRIDSEGVVHLGLRTFLREGI